MADLRTYASLASALPFQLTRPADGGMGLEGGDGVDRLSSIIEYGSNSNGKFTRFADGTQICLRSANISDSPGFSKQGVVYSLNDSVPADNVPANFTYVYYRGINVIKSGGAAWAEPIFPYEIDDSATNTFNEAKFALARSITAGSRTWTIFQVMIGYWK